MRVIGACQHYRFDEDLQVWMNGDWLWLSLREVRMIRKWLKANSDYKPRFGDGREEDWPRG
jgi:hypothetical protein